MGVDQSEQGLHKLLHGNQRIYLKSLSLDMEKNLFFLPSLVLVGLVQYFSWAVLGPWWQTEEGTVCISATVTS